MKIATMTLSARALADEIVVKLNAHVPAGLWLSVDVLPGWGGIAVFATTEEGSWGGSGIASLNETVEDAEVQWVVEAALDAIQDDVPEASSVAWPTDPTTSQPLPRSWAKVTAGVLSFGYGSLTLASEISLDEMTV